MDLTRPCDCDDVLNVFVFFVLVIVLLVSVGGMSWLVEKEVLVRGRSGVVSSFAMELRLMRVLSFDFPSMMGNLICFSKQEETVAVTTIR